MSTRQHKLAGHDRCVGRSDGKSTLVNDFRDPELTLAADAGKTCLAVTWSDGTLVFSNIQPVQQPTGPNNVYLEFNNKQFILFRGLEGRQVCQESMFNPTG